MPARYVTIANWVNGRGWKKGAELGIFDGRTHLYLLNNCPGLELLGVDVWDLPGFKEGPTKSGERCFCDYCSETRKARRSETTAQMRARVMYQSSTEFAGRSSIWQMPTDEAAALVTGRSLDFVFVDGDHSKEGVAADLKNWAPKIKPGGWLIGHDWNMQAVRQAVLDKFTTHQVVTADDHVWFVIQ